MSAQEEPTALLRTYTVIMAPKRKWASGKAEHRANRSRQYVERKEAGKCPDCGKVPEVGRYCEKCKSRRRLARKAKKERQATNV